MKKVASEFSEIIRRSAVPGAVLKDSPDRLRWYPKLILPQARREILQILDKRIAPYLKNARVPIDSSTIWGMKKNYSERLPKSIHNSTVFFDGLRSKAAQEARSCGLIPMLTSPSLRDFASRVSGYEFEENPGVQVIRYRDGDYVGVHNDHHPEEEHLRNGYVDLQITLSNDDVERQYLMFEKDGYFNQWINVGIPSGVSVSVLPFWHQVTPLIARRGRKETASRWLLLVSFVIR